jgi:SAM-dependent methyltransferase
MEKRIDPAQDRYQKTRQSHWDEVARKSDAWKGWGSAYHRRLEKIYQFLGPPGQRVLEIGCGRGDLLAALKPSRGMGADFSPEFIQRASQQHPELDFICADAHDLSQLDGPFDVIILSDTINDLWDVQAVLEQIKRLSSASTRVIVNFYSRLWAPLSAIATGLKMATPTLPQNWLTSEDVTGLFNLAGFEVIRRWEEILWPLPLPIVGSFLNKFLVRFWPFRYMALANFIVARPTKAQALEPSVSVVVPARNEAGNIPPIFQRLPEMGSGTELIFVEGHSRDTTFEAIEQSIRENPQRKSLLLKQSGIGKADAVRLGFERASGDILMILDADLTVPPEDLPRFYEALRSGKGEFVNGVRLVYPMEQEAMRWLNFLGNKFFSLAFSWLLGQSIKDTLCGTKALWRKDYETIAANRSYFGDFDPFGDFDLIFGAAKLNRKIIDLPIRYRERTYGTTNISRWKHGWLLLRMVAIAARRIKFV